MAVDFTLNAQQFQAMRKALADLDLPPAKRRRLLWRILSNGVKPAARRHARRQENAEGVKWPGRWDGRKAKMMRQLPGMMVVHELPAAESARIYLRGNKPTSPGIVGAMQQTGMKTTVKATTRRRQESGKRMASLRQAKRLLKLGYTANPVSAPRKPSVSELMETLTRAKASVIIRKMEGREAKQSWTTELPAREWLDVSDEEFNQILARQLQAINYGANVRAQDIKGKKRK